MSRFEIKSYKSWGKFPQRSQSLRIKSSVTTNEKNSRWQNSATRTVPEEPSKLILGQHDLIIQYASSSSFSSGPSKHVGRLTPAKPASFNQWPSSSLLFNSMTVDRLRNNNSNSSQSLTTKSHVDGSSSGGKANTLYVKCSHAPQISSGLLIHHDVQADSESLTSQKCQSTLNTNYLTQSCTFGEEFNTEDERSRALYEDYFDESEDEYLDIEENVNSGISQYRCVELLRDSQLGLGLSIQGGSDYNSPVIVVDIKSGSPADQCALLYLGDQITSVNEVPITENTSHQDALRLLSQCGDRVCLVVKHSRAVQRIRKSWRDRNTYSSVCTDLSNIQSDNVDVKYHAKQRPSYETQNDPVVDKIKGFMRNSRSNSVNSLSNYIRIDLFLAGISLYVAYSDKLRDSSLELRTATANSVVIQCINKLMCKQWYFAIKSTIDQLTQDYMAYFNQHYPSEEHFYYIGFVSECLLVDHHDYSSQLFLHTSSYRWLYRYLIVKGGRIYIFNLPPVSILKTFKHRLANCTRRNHNGSSGSSLGSVGSSASETSSFNKSTHNLSINGSNDLLLTQKQHKVKPDRLTRLSNDLDKQLAAKACLYFACHKSDLQCVKSSEQLDEKKHCFRVDSYACKLTTRYYSTENATDLKALQEAWTRANYNSVMQVESESFTVLWEEEDTFGSLILDSNFGFAFYDPKLKEYRWLYKFCQLRHSTDDGHSRLSLTFVSEPSLTDEMMTMRIKTYKLQSSYLRPLILCIQAFLSAKVYSLCL